MIVLQKTKIFIKNYSEHQELNKKILAEVKKEKLKDPKGMTGSNDKCWRSAFKFECEEEFLKPINAILSLWSEEYLKENVDVDIRYWVNVNKFEGANIFHTHYRAEADLSGVYYVKGQGTGKIRFATHEQMYRMIPPHMPFSEMIAHDPNDGDILLFPSYLLHDVEANPSMSNRVSVAFNIRFTK